MSVGNAIYPLYRVHLRTCGCVSRREVVLVLYIDAGAGRTQGPELAGNNPLTHVYSEHWVQLRATHCASHRAGGGWEVHAGLERGKHDHVSCCTAAAPCVRHVQLVGHVDILPSIPRPPKWLPTPAARSGISDQRSTINIKRSPRVATVCVCSGNPGTMRSAARC